MGKSLSAKLIIFVSISLFIAAVIGFSIYQTSASARQSQLFEKAIQSQLSVVEAALIEPVFT